MGTRADFYIGRGETAEWLGSVAFDGYPSGITPHSEEQEPLYRGGPMHHKDAEWPDGAHLFDTTTEAEFRERLMRFFQYRDDVTLPADGWPWPWEDSRTTDYAYAFDEGKVWASDFGREWWVVPDEPPSEDEEGNEIKRPKTATFPNMKARQNVTFGRRSGLIVLEGGASTPEGTG